MKTQKQQKVSNAKDHENDKPYRRDWKMKTKSFPNIVRAFRF